MGPGSGNVPNAPDTEDLVLPLVDSSYQLPQQDQLVPADQPWASVPTQPESTYLKVIDSLFDQNFLSSRINWFAKILSLLTVDPNMPQLGITRAEGFYKYLKNYNTDPSSDGLCYTFDPALLSNDVTALVPYTPQGINHAELSPVYFIFPGSHTSTMFTDAMTLANPMDTTPYNAQSSVYAVADAVLHYITANEAFLTGRDVYFVGFSLGGLRAIYTLYALQTYNLTIASRTHCISFNPWIGKFADGDLLGLATWLGVNNADDQLDPWHLARLTELRTQTGLPIHSVIERTLVLCIRDESASRLWQSENNATPPQRIGWGRLYLYPNAQPAATDPTVAHSILNWAGNAFPDVVPDIRVVKHGTFALSTQTMFMSKAGVHEPTLLTVTSEAQSGYHSSISQYAVHSFWRTPGLTSNQYLWTIVPINSAGLLRFVNKHDPTLEFRAKISYVQTENGNDQFTLKTEDGTWVSTGASDDYAAQELSDFEDGTHQYLSLIFRIPDVETPVALRNGGYLWSFHTEQQVIHSLEGQSMELDHTMRRTWDLPLPFNPFFFVPGLAPSTGADGLLFVDVRMRFGAKAPERWIVMSSENILASVHETSTYFTSSDVRYQQPNWRITYQGLDLGYDIVCTDNGDDASLARCYTTIDSTLGYIALTSITNRYFDIVSVVEHENDVEYYRILSKEHATDRILTYGNAWTDGGGTDHPIGDGSVDPLYFENELVGTTAAQQQLVRFFSTTSPYDVYETESSIEY